MRTVTLVKMMVVAVALGCAAPDARAQTTSPPARAGATAELPRQLQEVQDRAGTGDAAVAVPRFSLQRIDGGYLRLDAEKGSVAFCAPRNPSWNCATVRGDGTAAANEVVCTPRGDPDWSCQELSVDRAALEKVIARLQEEVAALKQKFDRRQEDIASLKQEFDRRQQEETSLRQEVGRYREQTMVLKQEVSRRQEEIASLKQQFDHRQGEVESLKQEIERLREQATLLQQEGNRRQEEIASFRHEAGRRREEIALLRQEIAALRAPPPPPADTVGDFTMTLPSRGDIARAGTYLQDTAKDAWHRLVDMISHFQRDVMRKS